MVDVVTCVRGAAGRRLLRRTEVQRAGPRPTLRPPALRRASENHVEIFESLAGICFFLKLILDSNLVYCYNFSGKVILNETPFSISTKKVEVYPGVSLSSPVSEKLRE